MHNNIAKSYDKFFMYEKILFFLYFHEHKNTKLNQFTSILERANFRALQFYPLKMNLVLEIWKTVIKEI